MSRPNNVRGPTSALTEFLRESGINVATIARRARTRNPRNQTQDQEEPIAGSSHQDEAENVDLEPSTRRPSNRRTRFNLRSSGHVSDNIDDSEPGEVTTLAAAEAESESTNQPKGRKRKRTTAAETKLKAKEKKKRGIKDSDDDDMDEDDDTYTAPSRLVRSAAGSKPAPGSFTFCADCEARFTVTTYTMVAVPGPGWLCHACAKAGGNDPFKKPQASRKRFPNGKRVIASLEERKFPSLVSVCVQLITKYINDVESLGDIGSLNVEAISKALSKSRCLTSENARLFYSTKSTTLTLYDVTNLTPDAFQTLAYLNPNLTSLHLDYCGQINDDAFNTLSTSLPALTSLELLGPFLVKPQAWKNFFETHPGLEKFMITQSPCFDLECIQSLISSCGSNLSALRLKEVGNLSDEFLEELSTLSEGESKLTYLDLSDPTKSCGEEAMINLLSAIGCQLTHLNVSNHILLTDDFLMEGIQPHIKTLDTLILNNLPDLTDEGVAMFFKGWDNNPALAQLDLSRNHLLADLALEAILNHSGEKLEELNINGWKDLEEEILVTFAVKAPELRKVDVGWVREMTDFVVKAWLDGAPQDLNENKDDPDAMVGEVVSVVGGCRKLEEVKVWGCNRITSNCPRRKGLSIHGIEDHMLVKSLA